MENKMESNCSLNLIFDTSHSNECESLKKLLELFKDANAQIEHIESRKKGSEQHSSDLEFFVSVQLLSNNKDILIENLKKFTNSLKFCETGMTKENLNNEFECHEDGWFPKHISDLDYISNHVLMYGKELDCDHPGFKDEEYRKRRIMFAQIAYNYKYGQPIPIVEYDELEKKTWAIIYGRLTELYKTHACKEYLKNFTLLQQHAEYKQSDLPQLEFVSKFLKKRTGFTLRPVAGYLSSREFLSALAFRVFFCTQYIRHHADPFYTPEPDCCHELLGHMPMLADPTFAQFSQEIGLASLGASDEEVQKLATCYFFSIEFGLCRQNGQLKVYGAGLLSSVAELEFAVSNKAIVKTFTPNEVVKEECLVTTFQNNYFETSSFEHATEQMRNFARQIKRQFDVRYNPYTESVEIIKEPKCLAKQISSLKNELTLIENTLERMNGEWIIDYKFVE